MTFFFARIFFHAKITRSDLQQYTTCILYQVLVSLSKCSRHREVHIYGIIYDISI